MRTPDDELIEKLKLAGQSNIQILDYDIDDRHMHAVKVGKPEMPAILFVHGSPGSLNNAMIYLEDTTLSSEAQVLSVDRPGFGYSDYGKTERSVEQQAALIAEVLKKNTDQPAVLVGHSYGGPVIARMAMDHPELVKGLLIVAGSISPELEPREWWRPIVDSPLIRWILPGSFIVSNQEIHALYRELELMMPLWKEIQCPVIVFQGETDKLVPAGNADFAELMIPDSLLTINMVEQGDHFIVWSRQQEMVAMMKKLLE